MPIPTTSTTTTAPRGRVIVAPETTSVGTFVLSADEASSSGAGVLLAPRLDFAVVNSVLNSSSVNAVVVATEEFSDHARKMLHEAGVALIVYPGAAATHQGGRCVIDGEGVTRLEEGVSVSAICSILNPRNLGAYRRFGITALGYFRFKFCLFQLFAEEPEAYGSDSRIEEYLFEKLRELGDQGWTSIRCVLSDPTSAELKELGLDVPVEVNPDLGLRGPRVMDRWLPELQAIRRFRETSGIHVDICAPFISSADEYGAFVTLAGETGIDLSSVGVGFTLEVPALALSLEDLFSTHRVDFMGIGTSDLFALYNAVDRNNRALAVTVDSPENTDLLRRVVACADSHRVRTFVCGEVRRNEDLMTELIAHGVDELICSPRVEELASVTRLSNSGVRREPRAA